MVDLNWRGFIIGRLLGQRKRSKQHGAKTVTEPRYEDLIVDSFSIHHYRHMSKPLVPVSKTRFNRKLYSQVIHLHHAQSTAQHSTANPPSLNHQQRQKKKKNSTHLAIFCQHLKSTIHGKCLLRQRSKIKLTLPFRHILSRSNTMHLHIRVILQIRQKFGRDEEIL